VNCLVPEIVVQNTWSHPEVLHLRLHNRLLKVTGKSQNLSVVFQPLRLDSGDIVVVRLFPGLLKLIRRLGLERFQQGTVQDFFYVIRLLTHCLVLVGKLLYFVVIDLIGVSKLESRQKRNIFR